jgi:uncharacterized protein
MKTRLILALPLALLLATSAMAQTQSTSTEKTDDIRRLMALTGAEKLQKNTVDQMMAAMKPALLASVQGDRRGEQVMERMTQLMTEEMKKLDFSQMAVQLYDKYFTHDDIKELVRFYESPVGQKAVQVLPTLTQESMAWGIEAGRSAGQRAIERLAEEFPEVKRALNPAR